MSPPFVPDGYTLEHPLGSGNTAHVYRARHPEFGTVALKLPKAELKREPVLGRMFENEVQITTALKHPRVVSAHAGYPTGAGAYLALEFCDGTLAAQLAEVLPLETAYRLVLDVAEGLGHSHQRQILHRDVKPANVFVKNGRAKLGDFGTGAYLSDPSGTLQTFGRVGTAFYMAPEVFQGRPATVRSDLYSLGILAYEVIAGVRPFTGEDEDALMLAHASGVPVALRQHRGAVSAEVGRVVACAMSRTLDKRYPSADAFTSAFTAATGLLVEGAEDDPPVGRAGRVRVKGNAPAKRPGRAGWFGRRRG